MSTDADFTSAPQTAFAWKYRRHKEEGKPGWLPHYRDHTRRIEEVLERHRFPSGSTFLELGCGAGNLTLLMAKQGFDAYGIDFMSEAIEWAKDNAIAAELSADFRVGDVADLQCYPEHAFDFVYDGDCLQSLMGVSCRQSCLAHVYRIMKPCGIFFISTRLVKSRCKEPIEPIGRITFDMPTRRMCHDGTPICHFTTEQEALGELRDTGFEIVHTSRDLPKGDATSWSDFNAGWLRIDAMKPEASRT